MGNNRPSGWNVLLYLQLISVRVCVVIARASMVYRSTEKACRLGNGQPSSSEIPSALERT